MVCLVCGANTQVINSRRQKRANQVWRRRRCLECLRVVTTNEAADIGQIFSVERPGSSSEPFLPDKLFTEVLLALQDRKDCYVAARELCATITQNLRKKSDGPVFQAKMISEETAKALKRFNKRAWMRYRAEHPSLLNA